MLQMKTVWRARLDRKPWMQGSGRCLHCDRRSLLESCDKHCEVISDYHHRKSLLFVGSKTGTDRFTCPWNE
jgi:hypothetical protein